LWAARPYGGMEREYVKTMNGDFVMVTHWAGVDGKSRVRFHEWPEAGELTYYLDDAPHVRA
jgi:hypothetical protein